MQGAFPQNGCSVVRAQGLGFRHQGKGQGLLLRDIDLAIGPGEMVGLSGLSGTGKSTLGDLLLGLYRPLNGQVFWGAEPILQKRRRPPGKLRPYYQKIYQDPAGSFPPGQSTGQALLDVIAYHGLAGSSREETMLLKNSVEPLGLTMEHLKRRPHQLSGGEMQRLALARVMLLSPRFLVADEPSSRLDISVQAMIIRLIAHLAKAHDCAVLLISHDRKLIRVVCSRAYVLESGGDQGGGAALRDL